MLKICNYENYWGHRHRLLFISKIIKKYSINTVLDIGCGAGGFLTLPLMQLNPNARIFGTDISIESINTAKVAAKKLGLEESAFFQSDITELDGEYDAVICSEVLEHIDKEYLSQFSDAIKRLVKKEGYIIITVPNGRGSFEKGKRLRENKKRERLFNKLDYYSSALKSKVFKNLEMNIIEDDPIFSMTSSMTPHVNFFSKKEIISLFSNCKLIEFSGSALFSGYFFSLLPPFQTLLKFNSKLGTMFPNKASGFYFLFRKEIR